MNGITIHDIARAAEVNPSTVSRALRGDKRIAPATVERILAIANKLNYTPNITARNLSAGKTNTIWLLMSGYTDSIEQQCAMICSEKLLAHNLDLLLVMHHNNIDAFQRLLTKLSNKITDGALIIPPAVFAPEKLKMSPMRLNFPMVFIDRWLPDSKKTVVSSDNETAAEKLTKNLLEQGAELFFISYPLPNTVSRLRRQATIEQLQKKNIPYFEDWDLFVAELKHHPAKRIAITGNSGKAISTLFNQKIIENYEKYHIFGGFFDYWENQTKDFYEKIFICRQNFAEISQKAVDLLLLQLNNHKKDATFHKVPAESFIEL